MTDTRTISAIARDIRAEWGAKVNYAARPYLDAMLRIDGPNDMFYADDAKSIVIYFLANANTFRGEKAKALKAELKSLCGIR
mgnify:CR=1 FL=1